MKKVINITLNSIVFAIEQDAYVALDTYIEQINARLVGNTDQSEIMADIESAMAEKFIAQGRSEKIAVSERDVERVRAELGSPDDFGEDVSSDEVVAAADAGKQRRLFRDTDDAVIAGVASGVARYFSIDPVLVRIAFIVSVFINGLGIIAYLILWLVVPAARTTTDKFAMQGKKMTIEDITARVKKNIADADLADAAYLKSSWMSIRNVLQQLFTMLGSLFHVLVRVLRYVAGMAFLLGGALGAAGLISVYSIVLLSEKTFLPLEAQQAIAIMLSNTLGVVAIGASFILSLIPLLAFVMLGVSLLKKQSTFTVNKTVTLVVVWIIALVLAGTTSALQMEKVWQEVGGQIEDEEVTFTVE